MLTGWVKNRVIRRWSLAVAVAGFVLVASQAAVTGSGLSVPFTPIAAVISSGAPGYTFTFQPTATESATVTLTDLAKAAANSGGSSGLTALTSLNLVVTSNGALVPGTKLNGSGTSASFAVTAGTTYQVNVVGVPDPAATAGNAVTVEVTSSSLGATIHSHSFVLPGSTLPQSVYFQSTALKITQAGNYSISLLDQQFPSALTNLSGLILNADTSAFVSKVSVGMAALPTALPAGNYEVYVYAQANSALPAGLFGLKVAPTAGGSAVLDTSVPVGLVTQAPASAIANNATQTLSLSATDLAEPTALSSLNAAVTQGAALLGMVGAGQNATFSAPAGSLQLWQVVTPTPGSAGAYQVALTANGSPLCDPAICPAVGVAVDPTSNLHLYPVTVATAGSVNVVLTDLQFPKSFPGGNLGYNFYQGGASLGSGTVSTGPLIGSIPAVAAGTGVLAVNATPGAQSAGVYSAAVIGTGNAVPLFSRIETIGANLVSVPFSVNSAGIYTIALSDLGWPGFFANQGFGGFIYQDAPTQSTGFPVAIYGGAAQPATLPAGNYIATINGTPAAGQVAGLYSLAVSAPAPVVTLTASPAAVNAGATSTLTWSATGASSCVGSATGPVPSSSKFIGAQTVSGSDVEGPFTTAGSVVYTLTCTGTGVSSAATATVTVTGNSSSGNTSSGGGGAMSLVDLLLVVTGLAARLAARRARA